MKKLISLSLAAILIFYLITAFSEAPSAERVYIQLSDPFYSLDNWFYIEQK